MSTSSGAAMEDVGGDSAISIARRIHTLQSQSTYDYDVHAIPGANDSPLAQASANSATTSSYLVHALPSESEIDELLEEYFDSVHWFSLVIEATKLRATYDSIRSGYSTPAEKPFLLLLSTVLGLSAWYRGYRTRTTIARAEWLRLSKRMIANAESQIVEIMDQRSVTAIQTLILLGSYYVYHGRPNLSFSLLGATIKAAQSIGLHKSCPHLSYLDREERKRVWWTIYTWDRFASVNYGQPFGISDKVCNVDQPEDMVEKPIVNNTPRNEEGHGICYSTYQRELNKLYLIASPAIERLYRIDGDQQRRSTKDYHVLVSEVTVRLWQWREHLPFRLRLNIDEDWPETLSAEEKAHRLQSLSLHLTFDSLILVLHRPFMKQRLDSLYSSSPQHNESLPEASHRKPSLPATQQTSTHEELRNAAVRTTRITELPQLAQHATDGHLINFLAMNLFNAAVVLIVMALSHPLTDRAQEAKRAVARVYRLQLALGGRSALSQQSATVLRSLLQLLISWETDVILAPTNPSSNRATPSQGQDVLGLDAMTVREALSIPLWTVPEQNSSEIETMNGSLGPTRSLNHGLESVQRAFAGLPEDISGSHPQSRRPSWSMDDIRGQMIPEPQLQQDPNSDPLQGVDWQSLEPGAEIGMHWIWDPAWDNLFDNVTA